MTNSAARVLLSPYFLAGLLLSLGTVSAMAQETPSAEFQDPYEVRDEVEDILSDPEFRGLKFERSDAEITESDYSPGQMPEWVTKTAAAIGSVLAPILSYLFWGVIAIICGLIIYVVYAGITGRSSRRPLEQRVRDDFEEGEASHSPAELAADVYLNRAAESAARGDIREAVAQLLLGAMSSIEREGLIRFRRGLTSRDYLRAARPQQEQFTALKHIVRVYEPICFGRREALTEHYETSLKNYLGAFHAS